MTKLSNTSNTEPHLKPGVNSGAKGMIISTCSNSDTRRVTLIIPETRGV